MIKFLCSIVVPLLLTSRLATSKQVPKKLHDKPLDEFVSLGSMDEIVKTSVFVDNTKVSYLNVSLEKLVEKHVNTRLSSQLQVQRIERIQIQAPSSAAFSTDSDLYSKAVRTLKRIAPNLQTVTLVGGHLFKPLNENQPEVIKEELLFVRNYLKAVLNAFKSQNVTVESVRFIVGIIVPDKTQAQVDFTRLIRSTFGYKPSPEEIESKTMGMIVQMNGTTCYLGIGMNPSKQEDGWMTPTSIITAGRSKFQEQVILTNFKKEWYTRVLDLVNTEPSPVHAKHRVNDLSRRRLFSGSVASDDPNVRAVGRTNDLPRRLFASQREMDFMQYQQPPQLQLEDFFDRHTDSIKVEDHVEKLGLRVTVQNKTTVSMDRMYRVAIENLKKLVPNLRQVNLYGGYVFQPRKPSRDTVQQEINYMAQNIRTWIKAFNEANITVTAVRFIATFVVANKIRETSRYSDALNLSFHYTATSTEIDQNAVRMRVEFDSVPCRVGLHFRDVERDQTFCPPSAERSAERVPQFAYFCSEKRPMEQWYKSVWSDLKFRW